MIKINRNLYAIVKPYDDWWNTDKDVNEQAKRALLAFRVELKKCRPAKTYEKRDILHMSYILYIINIRRYIAQHQYTKACSEIASLMHYEPFLQGRIYYNLLGVLEHMGEENSHACKIVSEKP